MKSYVSCSRSSLKRFALILIIVICGYPTSPGATTIQLPASKPCADGIVAIEAQPDVPARLSIQKAMCGDFHSDVSLLLENISDKQISGYEITQTQDYEYKKGSETSTNATGITLQPRETKEVRFSGGFIEGYSYGKPVGLLQRDTYKISWIKFADGSQWGQIPKSIQNPPPGHDLVLRDDKEPFIAAFQFTEKTLSVMSCDEYSFGGPGLTIEKNGCLTHLTFDFRWHKDFSYHLRRKPDETITIKAGDNLHGDFTFDSCTKTADGTIRDDNQNLILMVLHDTDTSGKRGYCSGPPDYK